ncbi:hypothetical protein GCM10023093_12810 [Nemorincola caseinilytica]|uniref:Uncharacterized protein n=1 Tax=Nemorincola caseinilytica TaxID=2054315 RepID=A0ABP8N9S2_9BACT
MTDLNEQLTRLTEDEKTLLLKAPVLISILAAAGDDHLSENEKAEVVRQAHLKTFTSADVLHPYYAEVDRHFQQNFDSALSTYVPFDEQKRESLTREADHINRIISKLDKDLANTLRKSLGDYGRHVKYADRKFVGNYILPFTSS